MPIRRFQSPPSFSAAWTLRVAARLGRAVALVALAAGLAIPGAVAAAPKGGDTAKAKITKSTKGKGSKDKGKSTRRGKGPKSRKPDRKAPPEPVLSVNDDGVVDYSTGEVRALGVGTPEILSPTGDITRRDLYETALDDGARRLVRALSKVRLGPGPRAQRLLPRLRSSAPDLLKSAVLDASRFFTDGTVHAPLRLSLVAWLSPPAENGAEPNTAEPTAAEPTAAERFVGPPVPHAIAEKLKPMPVTGVVLALDGSSRATLGLLLSEGDQTRAAGLPGDPLAPEGVRWFRAGDPALSSWVGPAPRTFGVHATAHGALSLLPAAEGEAPTGGLAGIFDLGALPMAVVLP